MEHVLFKEEVKFQLYVMINYDQYKHYLVKSTLLVSKIPIQNQLVFMCTFQIG